MKNERLKNLYSDELYDSYKFAAVHGRYITNADLEFFIEKTGLKSKIEIAGASVLEKPIYKLQLGNGETRILIWSQMHGNESTTTKAVFDLINLFRLDKEEGFVKQILNDCELLIIPLLNPDGAEAYTRVNANSVDLNRDLQELSQPESRILMDLYRSFKPDFCLNLHDQRTIFSAGNQNKPATLSFLTPSSDEDRSLNPARKQSMRLIAGMFSDLAEQLPGQMGRYDDAFNLNCAGDTFQSMNTPTLLFEAGHFQKDYQRETTRKFIFRALISCLHHISEKNYLNADYKPYFEIPENQKLLNDVIIRNAQLNDGLRDVSLQYKEVPEAGKIKFIPVIEKIAVKISNWGLLEIDAQEKRLEIEPNSKITENVIVDKIFLNNELLVLKY